jgi:glycosyltransferase involved in cell wall biosynthesis
MNELVSIIVPCYKQGEYLTDALDSVLAQTYPHWEMVVVNDASPDNTKEIATSFVEKDSRIKLLNLQKNQGLANARNLGIKATTAPFIVPLDSDDYLASDFLEKCLNPFLKDKGIKVVYTDAVYFGARNEFIKRANFSLETLVRQNIFQPCAMYKRIDYLKTKGYRKELFGYEDWDFWHQLINKDEEVYHIHEPLFFYRVKDESMLLALQGNPTLERQVRKRIYLGNRKKIQKIYPALAYYHEKQLFSGDILFKAKYRFQNLWKKWKDWSA